MTWPRSTLLGGRDRHGRCRADGLHRFAVAYHRSMSSSTGLARLADLQRRRGARLAEASELDKRLCTAGGESCFDGQKQERPLPIRRTSPAGRKADALRRSATTVDERQRSGGADDTPGGGAAPDRPSCLMPELLAGNARRGSSAGAARGTVLLIPRGVTQRVAGLAYDVTPGTSLAGSDRCVRLTDSPVSAGQASGSAATRISRPWAVERRRHNGLRLPDERGRLA